MGQQVVDEIVWTVNVLSQRRTGATIVLEGETSLEDWIASGAIMNAHLSAKLLLSIFQPASPLHDGAVIIRNATIVAASCYLPLADETDEISSFRLRSGLGLSIETDALTVAVRGTDGSIWAAYAGDIARVECAEALGKLLLAAGVSKSELQHCATGQGLLQRLLKATGLQYLRDRLRFLAEDDIDPGDPPELHGDSTQAPHDEGDNADDDGGAGVPRVPRPPGPFSAGAAKPLGDTHC